MSRGRETELNGSASGKKSAALKGLNGRLAFAIAATIGSSFQHGYNTGVINAPQKLIEEWIGKVLRERSPEEHATDEKHITMIFSIIVSIFCVGGMLGGCATGFVADRFGRKGGLLINTALVVVSSILQGCAKTTNSYEMLIAGRFLIGVNAGLSGGLAPMYLTEISPVRLRGATGTVYQLVITVSILLSQIFGINSILGTETEWPLLFVVSIVPTAFQIVTLFFCPESPKYLLVSRGNERAAEKALSWLRGTADIRDEMEDMKNELENSKMTPKATLREMFLNRSLRMPLFIAVVITIGQQFSGINAVMFFSTKIFKMAQMSDDGAQYATLGMGLVNVGMTLASLVLVEKAGRKTLLMLGFSGMCFISVMLAITLSYVDRSRAVSYGSIVLVLAFVVFFAAGPGSIPWFLVTELFSQSSRPAASSVAVAANWVANFLVGLGFLPLHEIMKGYVFVVFAVLLAMFSVFVWFKVPETKNKTTEEISALFRQRSYE